MKKLKDYINEEIINEEKIYSDKDIVIIQGWHSDSRLNRKNYKSISNDELISTILKSKNRVLKLFSDDILHNNDEISISNKSITPKLNLSCIVKNTDKLVFTIKSEIKKDNYLTNDKIHIELY